MNRLRDEFAALHEEEWESRGFWTGRKTVITCVRRNFMSAVQEPPESGEWLPSFNEAIVKLFETMEERKRKQLRLLALTERVRTLEAKVSGIVTCETFIAPITTFDPEPFELLQEIKAVVQKVEEDEYAATFFDANLGTAGCNPTDAIQNLKDLLLSRFDYLDGLTPDRLGPAPAKQLAVLRSFIRRRP